MNNFIRIPNKVLKDNSISSSSKLLLGLIISYSNNEYKYAFASNSIYAKLLSLSNRTITRLIKELKDNNYIIIHNSNDYNNREIEVNYSHECLRE